MAVLSALLAAFLLSARLVSGTCYWQNSTLAPDSPYSIAPDDTACFPEQENSPCCGTGWTCLSDGVCYIEEDSNSFYYRGTCTDRTWNSVQCPGWCFAQNSNTSIPLLKCTLSSGEDWYCCPGDDSCSCDTGYDAVKLGGSQPTTVTVIGSTSWPGFVAAQSPFSTSAFALDGTTTTTSGPSSTAASSTTTNTRTAGSTTQAGEGAAAAASASASAATTHTPSKSSPALAAGLGAGLGVAALAAISLFAFIFLRRQRRRRRHDSTRIPSSSPPPQPPPHFPEMSAWAESQRKQQIYPPSSELPSDISNTRSEIGASDPRHLHEPSAWNVGSTGRAEMQG